MKPRRRPLLAVPRQLSLLTETIAPRLSPDERRKVIDLLAGLLIEASGVATLEAGDDRG